MALNPTNSRTTTASGAAGGDLTGTYPNPTVDAAKITAAKMSSGAATSGWAPLADGAGGVAYGAVASASPILETVVTLNAAQILALNATPRTLVAAPGAGFALVPLDAVQVWTAPTNGVSLSDGGGRIVYAAITGTTLILLAQPGADRLQALGIGTSGYAVDPALAENSALVLRTATPNNGGAILTSSLNAGGAGYAANDTFIVDGAGFADAEGVVDTVDGGGAVLTYHLTNNGTGGYFPADVATTTATSGAGAGLVLNVLTVTQPAGMSAIVHTYYAVVAV